jgi:hypothetical protein
MQHKTYLAHIHDPPVNRRIVQSGNRALRGARVLKRDDRAPLAAAVAKEEHFDVRHCADRAKVSGEIGRGTTPRCDTCMCAV